MKEKWNRQESSYHHVLATRFGVRLTDEPIEAAALYLLKNLSRFFQLELARVQDAEEDAVVHLGVCNHVTDCLR